jgi:hypothetical protein
MNTYGVPTGGVPRREDEATTRAREDALRERNRLANIAVSERLRYAYMEAKEREDDRIESEAFADIVSTMRDSSALNKQVAGDHYKKMKIQPVEFIHANNIPFIEGCIIKYAARWRDKGGIKDIEKIIHFAQLLIELETKK